VAGKSSFPTDPIDKHRAMIEFDIASPFYQRELAPRLRQWCVGRAIYHSRAEFRRVLAELATFKPPEVA
jgi:hypothetical protein